MRFFFCACVCDRAPHMFQKKIRRMNSYFFSRTDGTWILMGYNDTDFFSRVNNGSGRITYQKEIIYIVTHVQRVASCTNGTSSKLEHAIINTSNLFPSFVLDAFN